MASGVDTKLEHCAISASDVRRVRAQFGASNCARLLGVDARSIHRWASNGRVPAGYRRKFSDLRLIGDLFRAAGDSEVAGRWMNATNPARNYEAPSDEILRGRWVAAISAARDYVSSGAP